MCVSSGKSSWTCLWFWQLVCLLGWIFPCRHSTASCLASRFGGTRSDSVWLSSISLRCRWGMHKNMTSWLPLPHWMHWNDVTLFDWSSRMQLFSNMRNQSNSCQLHSSSWGKKKYQFSLTCKLDEARNCWKVVVGELWVVKPRGNTAFSSMLHFKLQERQRDLTLNVFNLKCFKDH